MATIDQVGPSSLSFDGKRIVIGGTEGAGVFAIDGAPVASLPAGVVVDAALNRDGTLAVLWEPCLACADKPVVVWDVASGSPKFTLGTSGAYVAAFNPLRDEVVTGDLQGVVRVFDLSKNTAAPVAELHQHNSSITSVAFSPDGRRVLSGSSDNTARVWEWQRDTSFSLRGHTASFNHAMFDVRGSRVVTLHADDTVKIWDTRPFHATAVQSPDIPFQIEARLDAAGDRSLNATYDDNDTLDEGDDHYPMIVRDTRTGRRLLVVDSRQGHFDAAISGNGRVVMVAAPDGKHAKTWDVDSRAVRASLHGTGDIFRAPALDARGTRVVTASARAARIWDARSGKVERVVPVKGVIDASFSPSGQVGRARDRARRLAVGRRRRVS